MQTVELATLSLLSATDRDLSSLSTEEALILTGAINRSVQTFFESAPDIYKRTAVSHMMKAPVRVQFSVNHGETTINANSFLTSQRGCTLIIDGGDTANEIIDVNKMLLPWKGESGILNGTVYYDVLTFKDFLLERVVSDPEVVETGLRMTNAQQ